MAEKNWRYRNTTDRAILCLGEVFGPGEEKDINHPLPLSLGFVCTQEGTMPDPVLYHDDFIIPAGATQLVELAAPTQAGAVALTLLCLGSGGVECRFLSETNKPIPLDVRGFVERMPWIACARLYLKNVTEADAHISVSAVEVCA